ncbi:MAG: HNH endonuclease signature motif containing protein [Candidatus Nanopelagicales bacterium]
MDLRAGGMRAGGIRAGGVVSEAEAVLWGALRGVWLESRPGWTQPGWWDAELLPEVRALLWIAKGPDLVAAVQTAPAVDGSRCAHPHPGTAHPGSGQMLFGEPVGVPGTPCACQIVVIAAWAAVAAWAGEAADAAVLQGLGGTRRRVWWDPDRPEFGSVTDPGVETVAVALRRSVASQRGYLARVRDRAAATASLREAIRDGLLTAWQADLLLQDVDDLDPVVRDRIIDDTIAAVRERHRRGRVGWTFTEIRRHARRRRRRLDPVEDPAPAWVEESRDVTFQDLGRGQGRLIADLPVSVAAEIYRHLTATAAAVGDSGGDDRTRAQTRADVFTDLLLHGVSGHSGGRSAGGRREVALVISWDTLLDLDRGGGGEVPGCGPVSGDIARVLAADAPWRAWLTDAAGTVVATSPTTYTPTAAVARVVRAREPHCRFPGCRRTRGLDLDHVIPFPRGSTVPENLSGLCRRHHNHKTHGRWRLVDNDSDPDHPDQPSTWTWTDPTGITHTDGHQPPIGQ